MNNEMRLPVTDPTKPVAEADCPNGAGCEDHPLGHQRKPSAITPLAKVYRVPPIADLPDNLTPDERAYAVANERRWQVIESLRNLTRMLIDHPELPTPHSVRLQVSLYKGTAEERQIVLDAAEALGQPLTVDNETGVTVTADLNPGYDGPTVHYTVHAAKPKPVEPKPATTPTQRPSYDAHPTIILAPGQTYADWYARYAAHLDDQCPGWHLDDSSRMAGELAELARQRREGGAQR